MIPVALRIKGLYSFQKEQFIDFNPLTQAEIFGIFGTVGSGKSTILEAISFALYGDTQRMNRNDNRNYNMMNLKSNDLLIDFEFVNYNDKIYRFEIKGKRHGSDFEKVNTFERKAFEKVNGEWIPLGAITVENIIGLSYENFRRTIIIPQGQFQEFIQLKETERVNMLKEIFHLEKFDFFHQTAALEKENDRNIEYQKGLLAQFDQTTPEIIGEKETFLKQLEQELNLLRTNLENQRTKFKEQETLKKWVDQLEEKRQILAALSQSEPQITIQEKTLVQYESCVSLFKNQLSHQKETEKNLAEQQSISSDTSEKMNRLDLQIAETEKEFEIVAAEFKDLDNKKQGLNDLILLESVQKLHLQITALEKRISDGELKLQGELVRYNEIQSGLANHKEDLVQRKAKLPNIAELSEIKTWFTLLKGFRQKTKELTLEKEKIDRLLSEQAEKISLFISQHWTNVLNPENSFDQNADALSNLKRQNEKQVEKISQENLQLELQTKLEEFTQKLHDNEACPLCGSLDHPHILHVDNVKELLEKNKEQAESIREQNQKIDQDLLLLNQIAVEQRGLKVQMAAVLEKMVKEENELQQHLQKFTWKTYPADNELHIDTQLEFAKGENSVISTLETTLIQKEKDLAEANQRLEQYKKLLSEIQVDFQAKSTEKTTLSRQLKTLVISEELLNDMTLEFKIDSLRKQILSIAEKHEMLSKKGMEQKQERAVFIERIKTADGLIASLTQQLEKITNELQLNLENSAFESFEEIQSILSKEIDLEKLKKEISDFRQQLFKSKSDVEELEKQLSGQSFDPIAFVELSAFLKELEIAVQKQHDLFNLENAQLKKLRENFVQKENLQRELDKLTLRGDNIDLIKNLFKGNGFINYISTAYLQNLCAAANERFYKLTRQQLKLEISDKNEFQVRDFLNEGKVRSIKTLSGGQTFQAALSLALSLAESIQQQSKAKQNFFFLDEGFGSQDKHSLQIVFDSLKALREENRIIGIISHVEELQQEIDVFLALENDPETGSQIIPSWER